MAKKQKKKVRSGGIKKKKKRECPKNTYDDAKVSGDTDRRIKGQE